ncbi:MAG: hypothetical protein A3G34_08480 [Candidatus Lindowbacteria bacterium RIFCSPLOWO2_12_FULL_62_27]|nr:MAG: hypothetical protein A3G34_08480 [Candidatus Lindowbacteria bacterium RIFCSPLOWO2_12_FULL_62_27]OGH62935.1 MAG: hypothetical protein A3I06_13725 [Candidatus Lindowbacteria bacterium RIFCSPLOWO2_02_FULL_62_12]
MDAYTLAVHYLHEFSAGLFVAVIVYHFVLIKKLGDNPELRKQITDCTFKSFLATLVLIGVGGVLRIFTTQTAEREHMALIVGKHAIFGVIAVWFAVHLWRKRRRHAS